ncbi:MAG: S8 family peptidase [Gammaproteobacteria bacterium]|nr:S8 family peptidase [Gammaproteobacteria bacterium]
MKQTRQCTPGATGKASRRMKTTGKFLALAAAIGVVVFADNPDYSAAKFVIATPDAEVAPQVTGYFAAAEAVREAPGGRSGHVPTTIEFDASTLRADSALVVAQAGGRMGPPRLSEPGNDAAKTPAKIAPRDKMSGPVAALAAAGGASIAEIVVRYDQHPELFDDELVVALGGEVTRGYAHLDMRAIRIPAAYLEKLAGDDNINWLSIDDEMSATSLASRRAANVPAAGSVNSGYSGSNIGIAVLDTGIANHGDLSDNVLQYSFLNGAYPQPEIVKGKIVSANDSPREDLFGHGTHVAGVLSGSGGESSDNYKGTSTGAKVLSLQVLDGHGGGSMSDVMAALDWLLTYGSYFDIRVVNLSLGKVISESNETDPLVIAVENLWDAGMVVVVAAGNDGHYGSMTVTSPGNSRKVITVGSLTDNGTGTDFSDDYVSSFSSTGPTIGDYVLKPDLVAPGNRVVAAIPTGSVLAVSLPERVKTCVATGCSSEYLEMSGTSMATPMVSAAAALMLDKDPSLTPATVKARLMRSAMKINADPSESGAGLLDIDAALNDSGTVPGEALSPSMVFDDASGGVLVEDTAVLWGDTVWGAGYLFSSGFTWASGATFTDENGVTANGYMWTDGEVSAKGYMWTDGGISAKGYMWTDGGAHAQSFLTGDSDSGFTLNDDAPAQ